MGVRVRLSIVILSVFFVSIILSSAREVPILLIKPPGSTLNQKAGKFLVISCVGETNDLKLFDNFTWRGPHGQILAWGPGDVKVKSKPPNNSDLIFDEAWRGSGEFEWNARKKLYLIFNNPKTEDSGNYTCSASFAKTFTRETSVTINILNDFSFEDCPSRQAIILHEDAIIICRVYANPPANSLWSKNKLGIHTGRHLVVYDGLKVLKVTEDDGGTYTFQAAFPLSRQSKTVDINVEVLIPPKIIQFDESYEFDQGDRVELHCLATGYPRPKYYWTKRSIQNLSNVGDYFVNSDTGVLTIQEIERDSAGVYECRAVNSLDSDYREARVSVVVRLKVKHFQSENVLFGRDVVLICRVCGDPKPTVFIRKDLEVRSGDSYVERFSRETEVEGTDQVLSLTIKSARRGDEGIYYCVGQNENGRVERIANLQIHFAPNISWTQTRWKNHPKKTWKDNPVNLPCYAEAIPNATITWTFNGLPVVSGELFRVFGETSYSNLLAKPSTNVYGGTNVYGKYECQARNRYGSHSVELELTEARPPGIIEQHNLESNTARTITFELSDPRDDGGFNVTRFVVEYHEKEDKQKAVKRKEWLKGDVYILEDLKPRTAYVFRFAAKNDAGIGTFADNTEFIMPLEFPPEKPSIFISRIPDNYRIWWFVPEEERNEIEIFELVLREVGIAIESNEYDKVADDKRYIIDSWENSTILNIAELKANTVYAVELRAKNEIGYGGAATLLFETPAGPNAEKQILEVKSAPLITAPIVVLVVVGVLVILILVEGTCYMRKQNGVFYRPRSAPYGKLPHVN